MTTGFDLNIKEILKEWKVADALRELIANAIDESILSNTLEPKIYKQKHLFKASNWIIRDYGRGLLPKHLVQDESLEKLNSNQVVGRFGIGLKDAIAVLFRNQIKFEIISGNKIMSPILQNKLGFSDQTIHMKIKESKENIKGTQIVLHNLKDKDMQIAQDNFLIYVKPIILFENEYGSIVTKSEVAYIYFRGLKLSENEDYTFSYNIKKINKKLESKMNRERRSLGKEAYSDLVDSIICDENIPQEVWQELLLNKESSGEFSKKKVRKLIYEKMDHLETYVFITRHQASELDNFHKEIIREIGREIEVVKDGDIDIIKPLFTLDKAMKQYNDSFEFSEIDYSSLSNDEIDFKQELVKYLKLLNSNLKLEIVEKNNISSIDTYGYWDPKTPNVIYLVKEVLENRKLAIVALVHEYAHSVRGSTDYSKEFQYDLEEAWWRFYTIYN